MPPRRVVSLPRRDPLIAVLALAGLVVAGYLAWLKWSGGTPLFCTAGTGCDIVQASPYATILGAPTAFWGALAYVVILGLALAGFDRARWQAHRGPHFVRRRASDDLCLASGCARSAAYRARLRADAVPFS